MFISHASEPIDDPSFTTCIMSLLSPSLRDLLPLLRLPATALSSCCHPRSHPHLQLLCTARIRKPGWWTNHCIKVLPVAWAITLSIHRQASRPFTFLMRAKTTQSVNLASATARLTRKDTRTLEMAHLPSRAHRADAMPTRLC